MKNISFNQSKIQLKVDWNKKKWENENNSFLK